MIENTSDLKSSGTDSMTGGKEKLSEIMQLETAEAESPAGKLQELDLDQISSPALARLIEEVRNEEELMAHAYNRTHNRHNRSR
jgi:hypothetical protein